jgi:hypothetical protein
MSYLSAVCAVEGCTEAKLALRKVFCETHRKQGRKQTRAKYFQTHKEQNRARLKRWRTTTVNGFLCFVYSNMRNRVNGVTHHPRGYMWEGKTLCPAKEFYAWARNDADFKRLWEAWQADGRAPQDPDMPSINRKDNKRGYEIGNMEWVPFTQNCSDTSRWE